MEKLAELVEIFSEQRIIVAGDIMLDRFVYGDVERISPEGPVPVLTVTRETEMLGGAGNVVSNLAALGASPVLLSVTGGDPNGLLIRKIAQDMGADVYGVLVDGTRPTIVKTRYVSRGQQLLRSDREKTHPVSDEAGRELASAFEKIIRKGAGALVLSDYGKGVLTQGVLSSLISLAKTNKIPVLVDPKGHDYSRYAGADVVTPNRKELAEAAGRNKVTGDVEIVDAARSVIRASGISGVIATRSEEGLSVITAEGEPVHCKAKVREVFDVSGAGDTVIAVAAAALAAGADLADAGALANIAAGIAVSKVGTTPVTKDEMLHALSRTGGGTASKIKNLEDALKQMRLWKEQGFKTGFTNGCFDIIHKGHVAYMDSARERCDRLVLALNSDASVRILKGPSRPVNDEMARASVIAGLASIDMVVFFGAEKAGEDNTPCAVIDYLQPDIFFKGGDYTIDKLPEAKIVMAYGGEVALMPFYEGYSTTSIIERSRQT